MTGGPFLHPDQSPEEQAEQARRMAARRWAGTTARERSEAMRAVGANRTHWSPPDPAKPRCHCGRMTLARATARGRGLGHLPGCPFHRAGPAGRGRPRAPRA